MNKTIYISDKGGFSYWPLGIVLFFVAIACIQSTIVYLGFTSDAGLIDSSPYESGLIYQETIDRLKLASSVDWKKEIHTELLDDKGLRSFSLKLRTSEDEPFSGASVQLKAIWPPSDKFDNSLVLKELENEPGNYYGEGFFRRTGYWMLDLEVSRDGKGLLFQEKMFLKNH